jgi:hypothetical protein
MRNVVLNKTLALIYRFRYRLRSACTNPPNHRDGRVRPGQEIAFLARALKAPTQRNRSRGWPSGRSEGWSHEEFLAACLQREVAAQSPLAARAHPGRAVPGPQVAGLRSGSPASPRPIPMARWSCRCRTGRGHHVVSGGDGATPPCAGPPSCRPAGSAPPPTTAGSRSPVCSSPGRTPRWSARASPSRTGRNPAPGWTLPSPGRAATTIISDWGADPLVPASRSANPVGTPSATHPGRDRVDLVHRRLQRLLRAPHSPRSWTARSPHKSPPEPVDHIVDLGAIGPVINPAARSGSRPPPSGAGSPSPPRSPRSTPPSAQWRTVGADTGRRRAGSAPRSAATPPTRSPRPPAPAAVEVEDAVVRRLVRGPVEVVGPQHFHDTGDRVLLSNIPPSTDCSPVRSCGGCRSNGEAVSAGSSRRSPVTARAGRARYGGHHRFRLRRDRAMRPSARATSRARW